MVHYICYVVTLGRNSFRTAFRIGNIRHRSFPLQASISVSPRERMPFLSCQHGPHSRSFRLSERHGTPLASLDTSRKQKYGLISVRSSSLPYPRMYCLLQRNSLLIRISFCWRQHAFFLPHCCRRDTSKRFALDVSMTQRQSAS